MFFRCSCFFLDALLLFMINRLYNDIPQKIELLLRTGKKQENNEQQTICSSTVPVQQALLSTSHTAGYWECLPVPFLFFWIFACFQSAFNCVKTRQDLLQGNGPKLKMGRKRKQSGQY